MASEINNLLKLYLGADKNGGYQPIGCDERLKAAYPYDHEEKMRLIAPYLTEDHKPDWNHDLSTERDIFEDALRKRYPELEVIVARSLASRFAYGWR